MSSLEERLARISSFGVFTPLEEKIKKETGEGKGRIIVLAGPTACGKTALSIALAKQIGGEIVSADSMQVYRGMDIGTAKATLEEREEVSHHLIDICDIDEPFSVVDYYYAARQAIDGIQKRGKTPIVVGGSGFYLHTLIYGPPAGPPSVPDVRDRIEKEMDRVGADEMYRQLRDADPAYAETITVHDRQKIVRALEILSLTGERVSELSWKARLPDLEADWRCFFLHRPRPVLYKRVEERCEQMVTEGLLDEVEALEQKGLRENRTASNSIGYRQGLEFLDSPRGPTDLDVFMHFFKQSSRRYVKRQFTWFRKEPMFTWVDVDAHDPEVIVDILAQD